MELAETIKSAIPVSKRPRGIHPATKSFMGLRIFVNSELESIQKLLAQVLDVLEPGGVFVSIAFHSMEDRLVRDAVRHWTERRIGPAKLPVPGWDKEPLVDVLTPKPLRPTPEEAAANPRAAGAKLRAVKKR